MQIDPVDAVLARLRNVKAAGDGKWMASSPTRRDANPSLSIRRGTSAKTGEVICLLRDFGGSTTEEIVAALGMTMGDLFADDGPRREEWRPMVQARPKKKYAKPDPPPRSVVGDRALDWFANRGISPSMVERFGIYSDVHWFRKLEREGPALCFPYVRNGTLVNIKYRSPEVKDFAMVADGEPCFWGVDDVSPEADRVYVVEGELDRMAMAMAGIADVLSPPNGCESLSEDVMLSAAHIFGNERVRVYLAGDMDEKGEEMMDALAVRVGRERCFRVRWPEGCKDANDTLVRMGEEGVRQCVDAAEPLPVAGIITINEIWDDFLTMYRGGLPPGTSTGMDALDRVYTVQPGLWTIVTGSPGSGKTTLIDNVMVNIGERADWTFGICSMENRRQTRHTANIAAILHGKPVREGMMQRVSEAELESRRQWMNDHFSFIKLESPTIEAILSNAKAMVYRFGIKGLVIDPWNRIRHPQSMNNGDYVADALNRISEFADRFDVHVWLVAHPRILQKNAQGLYPVPTLYEISGSANFFNMCDFGISVWRDKDDLTKPSEVHIQKSRYDEIAQIGCALLNFHRPTGRFYDPKETVAKVAGTESLMAWRPPVSRYHGEEEDTWDGKVQDRPPVDLAALASSYAAADGGR